MDDKGITVKKEGDFGEWFSQLLVKAELMDYTDVSGCYVYRPACYELWERVQEYMDPRLKNLGVRNAYFPLFIPEKLLKKEAKHVEGFTPEVAWVTESGQSKLSERIAIRPTSETIMYDSYSKWIKSHRDLPIKINQWNNVVRWEFKNPVPLIRSREFLWQEGHSAHSNQNDAENEIIDILNIYADVFEKLYAVPVIKGRKTDSEKFAGADKTLSVETFVPNGRAVQGGTSHLLGQNFAKSFNITYFDKDEKKQHVWQTSWGISTRSLGVMIMMHSDNKGLVLPPSIASTKIVIVPIFFEKTKEEVLKKAYYVAKLLGNIELKVDDRTECSPGWKFNEWEMRGIPIRIEIGPKDLEMGQVTIVRRDTGKKTAVPTKDAKKEVDKQLKLMQKELYDKALKLREDNTANAKDMKELKKHIDEKKLVFTNWCGHRDCENKIGETSAKILCIPFDKKSSGSCIVCNKKAMHPVYIARSY